MPSFINALIATERDDTGDRAAARRHVGALSLSKIADGLLDPKLVLSWLLTSLGAPAFFTGMLVPIREAGALLPQLVLGAWLTGMRQRRWMWVVGSAGQGAAAALIALAALWTEGWLAGLLICLCLAGLAIARAASSVSYKDILGKTVAQTWRGGVTGLAGSLSAAAILVFATLMIVGVLRNEAALIGAVGLAAVLWGLAALVLAGLREEHSTPDEPQKAGQRYLDILRNDANLRRFIAVRGLLVSVALAPPYMVMLTAQEAGALGALGGLLLASSAASLLSSYAWGRMADRDSPRVLALAGGLSALAMGAAVCAALLGLAQIPGIIPFILFVLMLAYHGIRQARSVYLVDISDEARRSQNAALANTVIGLLLLLVGAFGGVLSIIGPILALTGFALLAGVGGLLALSLRPVTS
ncbi:MFS transporter [uncultured Roseovarius sp.]|uniref:MFS transporter n=1 Tax=uncultured Roseovarius sp. TaxID=293344 RepID=UPI0026367991|nr:MFS transporter [uncultured Roseovarius sp.]